MVYGDWGYRGCEGVIVCDSKDMRAKRQVVEFLQDYHSASVKGTLKGLHYQKKPKVQGKLVRCDCV